MLYSLLFTFILFFSNNFSYHNAFKNVEEKQRIKLSKLMSFILRHEPYKFGIKPNGEGFVDIDNLLKAINKIYSWVERKHIEEVVKLDEKKRYEIKGNKIRALYGHSYRVNIQYEEDFESNLLYHGTARKNLKKILEEGIKAMGRQFVHLSLSRKEAYMVGKRHSKNVVIFEINADCLRKKGYRIYKAGVIRLVKYVPPDCISSYK